MDKETTLSELYNCEGGRYEGGRRNYEASAGYVLYCDLMLSYFIDLATSFNYWIDVNDVSE